MKRRYLLLALLLPALCGCTSATAIDSRALVLGIAVDPSRTGGASFTFQVPSPQSLSGEGGGGGGGSSFYYTSAKGTGLDEAIAKAEDRTSRDIYLGQLRFLLFSAQLPPLQRDRLLAEEQRIGNLDHTEWFALADGRAAGLITPPANQEHMPKYYFSTHFDCHGCHSAELGIPSWRVHAELAAPGAIAVVPVVRQVAGVTTIDEVAAFARGKPPVVFSPEETDVLMLARGRLYKGVVSVHTPYGDAVVRRLRGTARRSAKVGPDGRLQLSLTLNLQGLVARRPAETTRLTVAALRSMAEATAQVVARREEQLLARTQAQQIDPFGFAEALYHGSPEQYLAIPDWGKAFAGATVRLRVRVDLPQQGVTV